MNANEYMQYIQFDIVNKNLLNLVSDIDDVEAVINEFTNSSMITLCVPKNGKIRHKLVNGNSAYYMHFEIKYLGINNNTSFLGRLGSCGVSNVDEIYKFEI